MPKSKVRRRKAPNKAAKPAPADRFGCDLKRGLLGAQLDPVHFDAFSRLVKTLSYGTAFQFILAEVRDQRLRDRLIAKIDDAVAGSGLCATALNLNTPEFATVHDLESRLTGLARDYQLIHLCGADQWLHRDLHPQRWQELNIRRDAIAETCRAKLVWWLPPEQIARCATEAPDLWSWRSGVYDFSSAPERSGPIDARFARAIDTRSIQERTRRAGQLRAWLKQQPPDDIRRQLLDELAAIMESLGELDDALRIRRDEELPLCEKLGDLHGRAMTLGQIADILDARGELDEALRIRREEELPVFEKLGDVRSRAVTLGKTAAILFKLGEVDEALRILREEALPTFEKLGDARERAVAIGKIADILQARGELDEALRIRREEAIPVYEKLGDARSRAMSIGKIAGIHFARGELDEALRICREEELPVYEKLGDVHGLLVARANIAMTLKARNQPGDRAEAHGLLQQALADAKKLGLKRDIGHIGQLLRQIA